MGVCNIDYRLDYRFLQIILFSRFSAAKKIQAGFFFLLWSLYSAFFVLSRLCLCSYIFSSHAMCKRFYQCCKTVLYLPVSGGVQWHMTKLVLIGCFVCDQRSQAGEASDRTSNPGSVMSPAKYLILIFNWMSLLLIKTWHGPYSALWNKENRHTKKLPITTTNKVWLPLNTNNSKHYFSKVHPVVFRGFLDVQNSHLITYS